MIEIPSQTQALIFDCDGTIADTMPMHLEAWQKAMSEYNVEFTSQQFYASAGIPTIRILENLNVEFGYQLPVLEAAEKKEIYFEELLSRVQPIIPVVELIKKYSGQMPMAVATGGIRRLCEKTLQTLGLWGFFDAVVTAEDVIHGKPSPDIFLKAAQKLRVAPEVCCVLEDADLGIQAAQAAKMAVVDVRLWIKGI